MAEIDRAKIVRIVEAVLDSLQQQGVLNTNSGNLSKKQPEAAHPQIAAAPPFNPGQVLTGEKVENYVATFGAGELAVDSNLIITPEARDRADNLGVKITTK